MRIGAVAASAGMASFAAKAAEVVVTQGGSVTSVGVSGIWVLANVSYAGMRAQDSASRGWRIASFIVGLPGTIVTFLAVQEGSERAYGVDIPKRRP